MAAAAPGNSVMTVGAATSASTLQSSALTSPVDMAYGRGRSISRDSEGKMDLKVGVVALAKYHGWEVFLWFSEFNLFHRRVLPHDYYCAFVHRSRVFTSCCCWWWYHRRRCRRRCRCCCCCHLKRRNGTRLHKYA